MDARKYLKKYGTDISKGMNEKKALLNLLRKLLDEAIKSKEPAPYMEQYNKWLLICCLNKNFDVRIYPVYLYEYERAILYSKHLINHGVKDASNCEKD